MTKNFSYHASGSEPGDICSQKTPKSSFTPKILAALCLLLHFSLSDAATNSGNDILGCLLTPAAEVDIGSPVVGQLSKVLVDRGDRVKKGQLLAQLVDSVERATVKTSTQKSDNRADIQAARAAYEFAKKKADSADELLEEHFISQQARDEAFAEARVAAMKYSQAIEQRKVAESDLAVANAQLGMRSIIAPFGGVIVERYLQPGARVDDKPIVKLVQVDPLYAEVVVSATKFGRIKQGAALAVTPELAGATPVEAKVTRVDSVVDPASNTYRVRLSLANPDGQIPSGLRCQINLPPPKR